MRSAVISERRKIQHKMFENIDPKPFVNPAGKVFFLFSLSESREKNDRPLCPFLQPIMMFPFLYRLKNAGSWGYALLVWGVPDWKAKPPRVQSSVCRMFALSNLIPSSSAQQLDFKQNFGIRIKGVGGL